MLYLVLNGQRNKDGNVLSPLPLALLHPAMLNLVLNGQRNKDGYVLPPPPSLPLAITNSLIEK